MTAPDQTPRRNWTRLILIAVLALSLLGNALTLGALIRLRQVQTAFAVPGMDPQRLPPALRRDLMQALKSHAADLQPGLRALQTARAAFVSAATAQPYDPAAATMALTDLRASASTLMEQAQAIVLDDLATRGKTP